MHVFVTGASGFVGSAVVKELLSAGHTVLGLARSEKSAQAIRDAGAEALYGDLEDLESLKKGAAATQGVIHTGFIHDFSNFEKSVAVDKAAIEAIGSVLAGTGHPLLVTGGMLGLTPSSGEWITEDDAAPSAPRASEATAIELAQQGVNSSSVRLPPTVHGEGDYGFLHVLISIAREKGVSAYIGEGSNRWPAVHRLDAARLYRLALEKGAQGARYNVIGDAGVPTRQIAEIVGRKLQLPVVSVSPEDAFAHFGWFARMFSIDAPSSYEQTKAALGWEPTHIGVMEDLELGHYFEK